MRNVFETWTRHLWIWLLPVVVLAANLLLLGIYQGSFASRRASLESIAARAGERLVALQEDRRAMELFLVQVEQQKESIAAIYADHFATEAERFTRLLREVRNLARQAGLQPDSFSYPKEVLAGEGLVRRSITFAVTGTYEQVRRLVNFFELSEQFITLENIQLSGDSRTDRLSIRLSFSTLFVATDEEQKMAEALAAIDQRNAAAAADAAEEAIEAEAEVGEGGGEDVK